MTVNCTGAWLPGEATYAILALSVKKWTSIIVKAWSQSTTKGT